MLCFKYLIKRAPRRRRLARCRPRKRCRPCNICEPAKAARERAENGKGTKSEIRRQAERGGREREATSPGQLGLVGARRKKGLDWLSPPPPPFPDFLPSYLQWPRSSEATKATIARSNCETEIEFVVPGRRLRHATGCLRPLHFSASKS